VKPAGITRPTRSDSSRALLGRRRVAPQLRQRACLARRARPRRVAASTPMPSRPRGRPVAKELLGHLAQRLAPRVGMLLRVPAGEALDQAVGRRRATIACSHRRSAARALGADVKTEVERHDQRP
jgi:hypothetical protein